MFIIGNCQQLASLVSFRILKIIISFCFISRVPFSIPILFMDWFQVAAAQINQSRKNPNKKSFSWIVWCWLPLNNQCHSCANNIHLNNFISFFGLFDRMCFFRAPSMSFSHFAITYWRNFGTKKKIKNEHKRETQQRRHWTKPINQVWQKWKCDIVGCWRMNALLMTMKYIHWKR